MSVAFNDTATVLQSGLCPVAVAVLPGGDQDAGSIPPGLLQLPPFRLSAKNLHLLPQQQQPCHFSSSSSAPVLTLPDIEALAS